LSEYHCSLVPSISSLPPTDFIPSIISPPITLPNTSTSKQPKRTSPHPLTNTISYDKLTPLFNSYICAYNLETEPKTFAQAIKSEKWTKAANEEL